MSKIFYGWKLAHVFSHRQGKKVNSRLKLERGIWKCGQKRKWLQLTQEIPRNAIK